MRPHNRKFVTLLAVAAAATVALAGCGGGSPATSPSSADGGAAASGSTQTSATGGGSAGQTADQLNLAVFAEPTSWDPSQAQEGHYFQQYQAAYDTLIRRMPDGSLAPWLATEWSYNDDNTVLTLKLRDDVKFTDGSAFNADAVKANIEAFQKGNGPQVPQLQSVSAVKVVDATTVEFTLSAPDPSLLNYLANCAGLMGAPSALGTEEIKSNPVGSGPYIMDTGKSAVGSQYVFHRNPDYWNPEVFPFDNITFLVLVDPTAALNAMKSGQADAGILTSAKYLADAEGAGLTANKMQVDWQGLSIWDREGTIQPALKDVRVRQAINYAVDSAAILKSVGQGEGTTTNQIWNEASGAFDKALDSTYTYDPEKAKSLLKEAGYENGFALTMPTTSMADPALNAALQQYLADVGITVTWEEVVMTEFFTQLQSGKFPVIWMSFFEPATWQLINQFVAPDATWNPFHTKDPKVDELIQKIQYGSEAEQDQYGKELNQYMVDQAWFAPFYRVNQLYMTNPAKVVVDMQVEQAVPSLQNYHLPS